MESNRLFSVFDISSSGLSAERTRMTVIANNIANAQTTRTPEGGPYRRQLVVFSAALDEELARQRRGEPPLCGVQVARIVRSTEPFQRIYMPGHPDADAEGYVAMPNVNTVYEMVDMMSASRAYQANLAVINTFREMLSRTLAIGR
jgi:flagellar basal-body rod protein FlgC